ncbi:uncharacterized protein PRCAT00005734001 [Priceomyces carsonii]|uniref:uncharacterized protein n=1 Tax=Priceomyces carsonii TaxID=28549 RepID=UPI002ED8AF95|nr:unnamed protein product [Priceomyces carsonii]
MSATLNAFPTWSPSTLATSTTLRSIETTYASGLALTLSSALKNAETKTGYELISLSQIIRGAQASLTIILAEKVLATATESSVKSAATQAIFDASVNLHSLAWDENLYGIRLNRPGNIIYFTVFTFVFFYIVFMLIKSRFHWYNITFFCGFALEFLGFLGRILAFTDDTNMNYFLLQFVSLTIAPAFIMAGIYFLFAQLVIIHGRQYSVLKPMWYSYMFIVSDVVSLFIQAAGGGAASAATSENRDASGGTNTMIAGIAFQVFSMSVFLLFWFEFINRIYFKNSNFEESGSKLSKRSLSSFFKLVLNLKSVRVYREEYLEKFYNDKYRHIRHRVLFNWYPLVITLAVIFVYIRSVYRVVELAQGFSGYLIEHEVFLMVLDALMIALAGLVFIPFHPVWVIGADNVIKVKHIKKNLDEKDEATVSEAVLEYSRSDLA